MPTTPTDILKAEHRIVEKVTAVMNRFAGTLSSGQDVDENTTGLGGRLGRHRRNANDGPHPRTNGLDSTLK